MTKKLASTFDKVVDDLDDEEVFKILVCDPYYGPRIKATRNGDVIEMLIAEGRTSLKAMADVDPEIRNAWGYPIVENGEGI